MRTPTPTFEHQIVDDQINDGYWIQAADIDGDGRPDLVTSGLGSGEVNWYQNPGWNKRLIHKFTRPVSMDQGDIAGDGRRDFVICHDYARTMFEATPADGKISWLRNPGTVDNDQPWEARFVGQLGSTHRLRLGHFTDSERTQLLAAPVVGPKDGRAAVHEPIRVVLYHRPESVLDAESWESEVADDSNFRVIHALAVGRYGLPSGGHLDAMVVASEEGLSWFGVDESGQWRHHRLGEGELEMEEATGYKGSGNFALGRIAGDPYAYVSAVEPFHGGTLAVYLPIGNGSLTERRWRRVVIDTYGEPNDAGEGPGHHVVCADFDGDGDDEFLVALRGPMPTQGVFLYKATDLHAARFDKTRVSTASAARLAVADFDGDDRLDFATIGYHVEGYFECDDPQVGVYLNRYGTPVPGQQAIPAATLGG